MKEKEIERILCSKSFATSLASGTAAAAKDARPLVSLHRVHRSPFLLLDVVPKPPPISTSKCVGHTICYDLHCYVIHS
ncbi:hypothetical protein OUZ56_001459 [Daphnia magna]|uniref:Uncharacterized protein n=1 Tax=Daphnia magna TaxID=35525 RepID=A0ABR0A385_9CRUS|nr:hypothetical protein OUZ56_001459 [Daphnia magna]